MHTDIDQIESELKRALDHSTSHRKFSVARGALLKGLQILAEANDEMPSALRLIGRYNARFKKALQLLSLKLILHVRDTEQNPATSLQLRNKLKPTADGKTDSLTDNKGSVKSITFFINLWNLIHDQTKDRAFI